MSGECMEFPATPMEFIESYAFKDDEEVYTNGADLISILRVKQMLDHYFPTARCHGCALASDNVRKLQALKFAYQILTDDRNYDRYGATVLQSKKYGLTDFGQMLDCLGEMAKELKEGIVDG